MGKWSFGLVGLYVLIGTGHTNASRGTSNAWHFLLCVDFGGYGVMRKVGSSVVSPLSGRMCAGVNHDSSGISLEG